ncbi:MAG: lipopolysaccharide biosynthesis protein, partial [Halioglobus sp.]|nr:lipopolysaccharide biosynthesis protein [Halioglobus sp.]
MTNGNSTVRGALWMATSGAASQALSFVVFIILARMLDPAAYGLIALSMTVILVLIAGSRLGLEKLLVQLDSPDKIDTDTAFLCTVVLGTALAMLLWLTSPLIADLVSTPELERVMQALAPVVAIKALEAVPLGLMIREGKYKAVALSTTLSLTAGGVAGIVMALNGYGVWALIGQELVKAACSLITLMLAGGWKPGFSVSVRAGRRLLAASRHIMGAEMTRIAQNHADRLIIGSLLGATNLGTYTIAAKVNQAASTILLDSLSRVGLPTLSRARHNTERLRHVYYQSQRIGAAVTLPVFVLLLLTAPLVVRLLLGQQWQASVPILQVLCVASCASSLGVFNGPLLLAAGRPDIVFRLSIGSAVMGIAAGLVAIPWG